MYRIFVTDDDGLFRRFVRRVAEGAGWAVTECPHGAALIKALSSDPEPGLILLDMDMPEMDGVETILNLPEITSRLPICLITGGTMSKVITANVLSDTRGLVIKTVLTKPIGVADLIALLTEVAANHDTWEPDISVNKHRALAQSRLVKPLD